MTVSGLSWPDDGLKLDNVHVVLTPFFFDGQFLGGFPVTMGSSGGVYQLRFVGGCEEDRVKVMSWPVAWIDWTEAKNIAT